MKPDGATRRALCGEPWRCASLLRQRYPTLRVDHKRRLVTDGPFYTAAGLSGGVDFAVALIEEDYGKQVALSVGQELMTYLTPKDQPNEHNRPHDYGSQPMEVSSFSLVR
jgi:transcriptional regulator GlxA family with amidase domain